MSVPLITADLVAVDLAANTKDDVITALADLLAIIVGAVVCAVLVTLLKQYAHRKPANVEADAVAV